MGNDAHDTIDYILETGIDVMPDRYDNLPALIAAAREGYREANQVSHPNRHALLRFWARCCAVQLEVDPDPDPMPSQRFRGAVTTSLTVH